MAQDDSLTFSWRKKTYVHIKICILLFTAIFIHKSQKVKTSKMSDNRSRMVKQKLVHLYPWIALGKKKKKVLQQPG